MSQGAPAYSLQEFIAACDSGHGVWVLKIAMDDAIVDFNLQTNRAVIAFIANGGLEGAKFHGTAPLRLSGPDCGSMVDSYYFYSGPTYGYLAFFKAATGRWIIKSFKKNDQPDPRLLRGFRGTGGLIDGKK